MVKFVLRVASLDFPMKVVLASWFEPQAISEAHWVGGLIVLLGC